MLTKKAEKHNIPLHYINYPYGLNMDDNMANMKIIIDNFLTIADKDLTSASAKNVCLVGMGVSGAIISTLYYQAIKDKHNGLNITYCHVRKSGETSHNLDKKHKFTPRGNTLYIFVDDFIEKGGTITDCFNSCSESMNNFKFDYVVCAYIMCKIEKVEELTKNIIYSFK